MVLLTLAMAAIAEMGEVDEMHSKEEVAVNGDISNDDVHMEEPDNSHEEIKINNLDKSVVVDEEAKETICDSSETLDDSSEEQNHSSIIIVNTVGGVDCDSDSNDDDKPETNPDSSDKEVKINASASEKIVEINDEVHEIEDDDDDDDELPTTTISKIDNNETIELNDSGGEEEDGDVIVIENGTPNDTKKDEIISLTTPEKDPPPSSTKLETPRRSGRNLNKKSLRDEEKHNHSSEESDIEEVLPQDPLAVSVNSEKTKTNQSTIVVKDTKRLVEIAAKTNNSNSGKKEPTLVIIDTNSILSGRGPVPINNKTSLSTSSYSTVLPMALPAQGMYPPNMRATITPIPPNTQQKNIQSLMQPQIQTPLLPTLTDDMFVVEAPSFIVPYVYEKPPVKDFKEFVKDLKETIQQMLKNEEEKDGEESMEVDEVEEPPPKEEDPKKPYSYFESPLGKFFIDIGFNLVQEYVQSDLLKQQKRKRDREGGQNPETDKTIQSLLKNLEFSKENNEPYKMPLKKCEFCSFKTESALALGYHLETPHMRNFVYRCNFCPYEIRSPHDILFHTEAEHAVKGHLQRAPAFHQCPNCPFEDNQKGKLSRHLVACMRKFKPERNLEPPADWEPPAKIPRVPKMKQGLNATAAAYQSMSKASQYQFLSKMQLQSTQSPLQRGRGRPLGSNGKPQQILRPSGMVFKQHGMSGGSVLVPTNYQLSGNQVFQVVGGQDLSGRLGNPGQMAFLPNIPSASSTVNIQNQNKKPVHQPSISITPLPRATSTTSTVVSTKPGDSNSKNSFVICEICDGYIKDLEQLRNHMQWIHKIKIHPKMIYNRPPLNCQKCQFRFFTDQGLERHLLGSHGLVTSSMQDAANKSKDSGRCPVCGRVYQWKLLNHVARDHNMTLKPAHLSYKCTVCTATFGMYKQFENHVYSAHSVVAKRVMDKKTTSSSSSVSSKADQIKPLKINDEITIIPQPAKSTNGAGKEGSPSSSRNSTPSTSKNPETTMRRTKRRKV